MLKVDIEKLLQDYLELVDKQKKGYEASEVDARAFAQAHGYNEKKTEEFVRYVQELGKGGLSVTELHKLEHLSAYIDEVPDEIEEELEEKCDSVAHDPAIARLNVI